MGLTDRTPFTYLIRHIPSGRVYYGCRFARGCSPSDLWTTYFTSSKNIHRMIEEEGVDAFESEIRRTFDSIEECRNWEHRLLKRIHAVQREDFLNKSDGKSVSPESAEIGRKNRISSERFLSAIKKIGENNKGRVHSSETREKISKSLVGNKYKLGKKETDATRRKKRESKLGKPSNAVGNHQPPCSCILCGRLMTSGTIQLHYASVHLGIKRNPAVKQHSEEAKYKMRIHRNKFVTNGSEEILIESVADRFEFLSNHPEYSPGKLDRKKRGTQSWHLSATSKHN